MIPHQLGRMLFSSIFPSNSLLLVPDLCETLRPSEPKDQKNWLLPFLISAGIPVAGTIFYMLTLDVNIQKFDPVFYQKTKMGSNLSLSGQDQDVKASTGPLRKPHRLPNEEEKRQLEAAQAIWREIWPKSNDGQKKTNIVQTVWDDIDTETYNLLSKSLLSKKAT